MGERSEERPDARHGQGGDRRQYNRPHQEHHPRHAPESFYNSKPVLTLADRKESPILRMRSLNNWIKSVLISNNIFENARVLDLCCGKGGDLRKFSIGKVSSVCAVDIAENSVNEARDRYNEMRQQSHHRQSVFEATFDRADVCSTDLVQSQIYGTREFDFVNCQFAIHYSFSDEASARMLLRNASSRLVLGGRFVGTFPNANWLIKKLRSVDDLSFGNSVYSVTFTDRNPRPFGHAYVFHLIDAVDDVPEYVTPLPVLERLAAEYGMRLCYCIPFHQFFYDNCLLPDHFDLVRKMQVVQSRNPPSELSDDEWEAAGIYSVFAFEKVEKGTANEEADAAIQNATQ